MDAESVNWSTMPASSRVDTYRLVKPWYHTVKAITYVAFRLLFGLRIIGMDRVPRSGPVIIAPIHLSELDPPMLGCIVPRYMRFMAKEQLFKGLIGRIIASVGAFPVYRGESDSSALRLAKETLTGGGTVLIFPEGRRGDGLQLQPIQAGIGMLAERTAATIVPVGICGTHIALPRNAKRPQRARVTIAFGQPFSYADVGVTGRESRQRFNELLAQHMAEATAEAGLVVRIAPSTTPLSPGDAREQAP